MLFALENGDFDEQTTDEASFDPKMTKLSQIPKYWLASMLNSWQPKLTKPLLEALDNTDGDCVRNLVEFSTGIDFRSWKLPRSALHKAALAATLSARYAAFGSRLSDRWCATAIADNRVDWQKGGVYKFVTTPEVTTRACALENINGIRAELPNDCSFAPTAEVLENWSDVRAALRVGWRVSGDRTLFKGTKFVLSINPKVFQMECDRFLESLVGAAAAAAHVAGEQIAVSGSATAAASRSSSSSAPPAITEDNTTIGKAKRKAKRPTFMPATASLVVA